MKFKLKNARISEKEGVKIKDYGDMTQFPSASASFIEVKGRQDKIRSLTSDRVYYILEGDGEFMINGERFSVKKSDVIMIPKKSPYSFWGTMKMFLVHTPAFDPNSEEQLQGLKEGIKKVKVKLVSD